MPQYLSKSSVAVSLACRPRIRFSSHYPNSTSISGKGGEQPRYGPIGNDPNGAINTFLLLPHQRGRSDTHHSQVKVVDLILTAISALKFSDFLSPIDVALQRLRRPREAMPRS